jgi:hypothetical protein
VGVSTAAALEARTTYHPNAGSFTVSETGGPAGYQFTGFSGDCDSSGNVSVAVGETKTCTLTNNDVAPEAPPAQVGCQRQRRHEDRRRLHAQGRWHAAAGGALTSPCDPIKVVGSLCGERRLAGVQHLSMSSTEGRGHGVKEGGGAFRRGRGRRRSCNAGGGGDRDVRAGELGIAVSEAFV